MSVLQTIDLKKYYGTEPNITRALDGVNFSVEDGEFVAVVGTSGSGKSTLLHMMGGLDTPTSGNVIVRDKELSKMNDEQLTIFRRRNIGFIFQNYNLVPILNVYENIVLPVELDGDTVDQKFLDEIAHLLGLEDKLKNTQTLAVKGTRSRPVDCLHPEEVEALFKVLPRCSTLEQVIVMGLLNTGMRRGELAGLTWEDIDFDHCTVHVDKSLLIVNKGYHLTTTKEDNVRDIDVAPEFMEYLKTYRDQWLAQKHRMGSAWQTCMDGKWESYRESLQKLRGKNFIVINDFGWPISPDHYGKIVDRVAEKAGIRKIHPHMFRHTFVSILLSNPDIGVATVAAEAGHAQPSTTLAIYTQVYHKRQDSIRSQMSETLYKRKTPER